MRLEFKSLAFNFSLESTPGYTPSWSTALGQTVGNSNGEGGHKITINDEELFKGMIYSRVSPNCVSIVHSKHRITAKGNDDNSPIVLAAMFSKVYINDTLIDGGKFILIIFKEETDNHTGRLSLRYGNSCQYDDGVNKYNNEEFFNLVKSQLGLADDACWFVHHIDVVNQENLYLRAKIVNKDGAEVYKNKDALKEAWGPYYSDKINFKTGIVSDYSNNLIAFGAPGTGKSFSINNKLKSMLEIDKDTNIPKSGNYIRVTFHQDYSYAQFVGTYKPTMNGNAIEYRYVPGPFMRVLSMAYKNILVAAKDNGEVDTEKVEPFVLVIEEVNRAKAAAVFGDMFQLLDRDDDNVSEYDMQPSQEIKEWLASECGISPDSFNSIKIPDNMFIWASMNSADQGVFPMDTAMKRRWEFEYVGINDGEFNKNKDKNGNYIFEKDEEGNDVLKESQGGEFVIAGEPREWNVLRRAINAKLVSDYIKVHEDKLMGPFFIKTMDKDGNVNLTDEQFINLFCEKVLMYLFEDAAKTKRPQLFSGITEQINLYSHICEKFKSKGLGIFGDDFKDYYDVAKKERNDERTKATDEIKA